ncbi:hypothetical protein L6452_29040 [Arctium lappa]|uniref:Uncharacterized protein n=1 Tax=Arctium lappa TaxID=4217 RepID=A0ACB8ZGK1_ARCLA|nr:hypothetical protein L6452_29040 [Arctium lappa]
MDVIRREKPISDPKRNHRTGNINHLVYDKPKVLDLAAENLAKWSQPRLIVTVVDEQQLTKEHQERLKEMAAYNAKYFDTVTVAYAQQMHKERQEQLKKRANAQAELKERAALTGRAAFNANYFDMVTVYNGRAAFADPFDEPMADEVVGEQMAKKH